MLMTDIEEEKKYKDLQRGFTAAKVRPSVVYLAAL